MAPYFAGEYGRRSRAARRRESAHMRAILTKNDLFAIGATLYKLLTGHNPTWDGGGKPFRVTNNPQAASEVGLVHILQDYTEYMAAKRAGDAPKMDEIKARYTLVNAFPSQGIIIADPIFEVLSKMMAFDAEDTYANFIDARHALELALTGLAIGDRLPEAGEEEDSGTHSVLTGDLEVVEDAAEEDDDGSVSLGPVLDGVPGVDEVDADELVAAAEEAAEEATAAAADDSVPPPTPPGALDEPSELTSGAAQVIEPVTRDELQGILFGGVAFPEDVPFTVERISAYLGSHPEDAGLAMAAINYVTNPANNPEGGQ